MFREVGEQVGNVGWTRKYELKRPAERSTLQTDGSQAMGCNRTGGAVKYFRPSHDGARCPACARSVAGPGRPGNWQRPRWRTPVDTMPPIAPANFLQSAVGFLSLSLLSGCALMGVLAIRCSTHIQPEAIASSYRWLDGSSLRNQAFRTSRPDAFGLT